jgi:hypothetical protein
MKSSRDTQGTDTERGRRLFGRRREEPVAPAAEAAGAGLGEERRRAVEAYFGVYPVDADARRHANRRLREPLEPAFDPLA